MSLLNCWAALTAFSLAGSDLVFGDAPVAGFGVTGGIEVAAVAFGSGSSTHREKVVVKALAEVKVEDALCI